jgi:tetratricopeptide (TPR) repeat protein
MAVSDPAARAVFLSGRERAVQHWLGVWQAHGQEPAVQVAVSGHALRALAMYAADEDLPDAAVDLALALDVFMIRQGQWLSWEALLRRVLAQVKLHGSSDRQFALRHSLATICFRTHRLEESIALAHDNYRWASAAGQGQRQAMAAINLAEAYLNAQDFERALARAEEAAMLAAANAMPWQEADGLIDAARALMGLGELAEAERRLRCADMLAVDTGYPVYQAKAQLFLGQVLGRLGRWQEALQHLEMARRLVISYGDEVGRAVVQIHLGRTLVELGRLDEAVPLLEDAVMVHRRHGNHPAEQAALERLREATARSRETGDVWLQGNKNVDKR